MEEKSKLLYVNGCISNHRPMTKHEKPPYVIEQQSRPPHAGPLENPFAAVTHIGAWTVWIVYLTGRFIQTASHQKLSTDFLWAQWILLGCELILTFYDFHQAIELCLSLVPSQIPKSRPICRFASKEAPVIDVFITVCGEAKDLIMDTVKAAAYQDYPRDRYKVFLLDDAHDDLLRQLVDEFNETRDGSFLSHDVIYYTRPKVPGKPHYFKAGNLRAGLENAEALTTGSTYFAALDADMIPEPSWLSNTVPHLVTSPDVALVNPPQSFYNGTEDDTLAQDSNIFAEILEPMRDRFGFSQCSGSGYVMRKEALNTIGGWPLVNVGEDIICSHLIIKAGWKTAFIEDRVQYGLMPGSFYSYIMQRIRWSDGTMLLAHQILRGLFGFTGKFHGTRIQWVVSVLCVMKAYISVPVAFAMVLQPICLIKSMSMESGHSSNRFGLLGWWLLLQMSRYAIWGKVGIRNYFNARVNKFWTVPYSAFCVFRSAFSGTIDFKVTGTVVSKANERSAKNRQPLPGRMLSPAMLMHSAYLAIVTAAFIKVVLLLITSTRTDHGTIAYTGATIQLLNLVASASVPVRYMLFPPTVPERRDLLEEDEHGIFRSKKKGWNRRETIMSWELVFELVILLWLDWAR